MKAILMMATMIFLHIFADYHVQGILSKMKQKNWWKAQIRDYENSSYRNDYRMALGAHAFEWSFITMLPCALSCWNGENRPATILYAALLVVNTIVHFWSDHAKANKRQLNLVGDQLIHILQVLVTWGIWAIVVWW